MLHYKQRLESITLIAAEAGEFDIRLDGEMVYTVRQFALLTHRSEQMIRYLVRHGNRIRRLRALKITSRTLYIYATEYHSFPFAVSGKSREVGFYDSRGRVTYVDRDAIGMYIAEHVDGAIKEMPK